MPVGQGRRAVLSFAGPVLILRAIPVGAVVIGAIPVRAVVVGTIPVGTMIVGAISVGAVDRRAGVLGVSLALLAAAGGKREKTAEGKKKGYSPF